MALIFSDATLASSIVRVAENLKILKVFMFLASLGGEEVSLSPFHSRMLGNRI